jgi:RHS repeat-associated protein
MLAVCGVFAVSAVACEAKKPSELEILPKNPSAKNIEEVEQCAGDPVDCATGDLSESQTDLRVGGRGPKLEVSLSYNSLLAVAETEKSEHGTFGYGWTGPYTASLTFSGGSEIATVHQDNGSTAVFFLSGGKYVPESWIESELATSGSDYIYTLPDQAKLEFNSSGQLIKETDRNGNAITLTYNSEKRLEKVTDEASRELKFVYNGEGLVESVKDPMGRTVKYTYLSDNLIGVTLPGESGKERWKFEYSSHEMTSMTDGRSEKTTTEYEGSHRVSKQTDPMGHETKWKYSTIAGGTETVINEPNGSETVEQFNMAGEPTKVIKAHSTELEATTKYEYNSSFAMLLITDPDEHSTEYGYDAEDNKIKEKDANGNEKKWKYDKTHDVETETTPKEETTTITRNADGDPEVIERTVGGKKQETKYKYGAHEDLTEETDALGNKTEFKYDSYGDRESETDAEGDKRTWEYNTDSEVTGEVSPRGNVMGGKTSEFKTTTERDEQGRPLKITDPLSHTTEYTYNGDSNVETEKDGNGHTTKNVYNEDDEQSEVIEPKSTTKTGYDSEGQVTSHTDGNEHVTEYKRNALEEISEEIDPLSHKTKKKYDKAGNLTEVEDAEGRKTTYKYDPGNRLTEVAYSEGGKPTVKYEYDKDGDVTKMVDSTGETTDKYDELDRLTESKDAHGNVVKYEYNLNNQPTEITYPNTKKVTREYDKDGRLDEVKDWLGNTSKFKYNPDSEPSASMFPGTKNEDTYAYDNADQMSEVKMLKEGAELASLVYTRDKDGQVEKAVSKGLPKEGAVEYTNDEDKRLTKAGGAAYKYDAANNPTEIAGAACTYNADEEIEKCGKTTDTYNKVGERTKAEPETAGETLNDEYNQAGVLTGVKRTTPEINDTYAYNGDNLRVSQTIKGTTTFMAWDTAEKLPLLLNDGANSYIYGPGNLPIEQINASEEPLYFHHDQQGSTRMLTNGGGEDKGAYTYEAYGNTQEHTGAATTGLEYDGQYTNTDTGLIYLRAREYDPQTAQFLSVDPALGSTGEPYTYTTDNPLNGTDVSGECECKLEHPVVPIALKPGESPPIPPPPRLACTPETGAPSEQPPPFDRPSMIPPYTPPEPNDFLSRSLRWFRRSRITPTIFSVPYRGQEIRYPGLWLRVWGEPPSDGWMSPNSPYPDLYPNPYDRYRGLP